MAFANSKRCRSTDLRLLLPLSNGLRAELCAASICSKKCKVFASIDLKSVTIVMLMRFSHLFKVACVSLREVGECLLVSSNGAFFDLRALNFVG